MNYATTLTSEDWKKIEAYVDVFQPVAEFTVMMSAEKYLTISSYIPMIVALQSVNDYEVGSFKYTLNESLKNAISNRLSEFRDENETANISMVLDPRYKIALMKEDLLARKKPKILNEMMRMKQVESNDERHDREGPPVSKIARFLASLQNHNISRNDVLEQEFQRYLSDPVESSSTDILKWWKNNMPRLPNLSIVARKYFGIPTTQASSERLFSMAGNLVKESRVNLLTENVEQLAFLHENL